MNELSRSLLIKNRYSLKEKSSTWLYSILAWLMGEICLFGGFLENVLAPVLMTCRILAPETPNNDRVTLKFLRVFHYESKLSDSMHPLLDVCGQKALTWAQPWWLAFLGLRTCPRTLTVSLCQCSNESHRQNFISYEEPFWSRFCWFCCMIIPRPLKPGIVNAIVINFIL